MPYVAIKSYPKDEETKRKLVEKINEAVMEVCGVPQQAVTITYEEFTKEEWPDKVVKAQVEPIADKLYINKGEKLYKEDI